MDTDSVKTLSIKGLSVIPEDERCAYSMGTPSSPPPSYMKVTASSKLKIVKIVSATLVILTVLIGVFVLVGLYITNQHKQHHEVADVFEPPQARLAFLKELKEPKADLQEAAAFSVKSTETQTNDVDLSEEERKAAKKAEKKRRKEQRKKERKAMKKAKQAAKVEVVVEEKKPEEEPKEVEEDDKEEEEQVIEFNPFSILRRLNIPKMMEELNRVSERMEQKVKEQRRRERIACLLETRRHIMEGGPFVRRLDGPPPRRLIPSPNGNGLIDCEQVMRNLPRFHPALAGASRNGNQPPPFSNIRRFPPTEAFGESRTVNGPFNPSGPLEPFTRALRARTVTFPIVIRRDFEIPLRHPMDDDEDDEQSEGPRMPHHMMMDDDMDEEDMDDGPEQDEDDDEEPEGPFHPPPSRFIHPPPPPHQMPPMDPPSHREPRRLFPTFPNFHNNRPPMPPRFPQQEFQVQRRPDQPMFEEETVPNFPQPPPRPQAPRIVQQSAQASDNMPRFRIAQSSPLVIYKHPMHEGGRPDMSNSPVIPRLPRK